MPTCGVVQATSVPIRNADGSQTVVLGARDVSMKDITENLNSLSVFGRPVIDQTGLGGKYDFSLRWTHESRQIGLRAPGSNGQVDEGASILENLNEQFGMKLKPTRCAVRVLVIDHVEKPTPN